MKKDIHIISNYFTFTHNNNNYYVQYYYIFPRYYLYYKKTENTLSTIITKVIKETNLCHYIKNLTLEYYENNFKYKNGIIIYIVYSSSKKINNNDINIKLKNFKFEFFI